MNLPSSSNSAEALRPRLFGIAYRMLGDAHDAEDIVQEAMLRWQQQDAAVIASAEAWLVAVTTRLSIDRLRRVATERALYAGPWLPEPIATAESASPSHDVELASDLSMAFLVLLERLAPEERAAFLLRDVFDTGYGEIAAMLEKSEAATRQLVHRARTRVRSERARVTAPRVAHERLLHRFLEALQSDNQDAVLAVFTDDAVFASDGGGKVSAMRNTLNGATNVVRALLGYERLGRGLVSHGVRELNGTLAIVTYCEGRVMAATFVAGDGEHIAAVYRVLNPDKLERLQGM